MQKTTIEWTGSSFLSALLGPDLQAKRQALIEHPLWRAIESGQASLGHLQVFALQDAWLVQHSPQLEALLLAHAPDEAAHRTLSAKHDPKAVFAGQGSLQHFGAGISLTPSDFEHIITLAGCLTLTSHFYYALLRHGFVGMLASLSASESVFIAICQRVGPALQRHYHLTDEQVAFFPLHDHLEESVNGGEAALLERLCQTPAEVEALKLVVSQTYDCEKLFYDTVWQAGLRT
ncbi:hypothetical protein FNU79_13675 [Deinococcus detaillensis]|uniref:Thiaminase-2/PQQC domain-containing protein n=1 Tax=Deinococcus detaillensis TaxID=2592048 RepID=A0A553UQC6_9DEIO|nr:hypothetical protein [Deinococcus detaillensis]TSA82420.1 hypothetical protein FNU79_13675 [Deinococcus detaillensis]